MWNVFCYQMRKMKGRKLVHAKKNHDYILLFSVDMACTSDGHVWMLVLSHLNIECYLIVLVAILDKFCLVIFFVLSLSPHLSFPSLSHIFYIYINESGVYQLISLTIVVKGYDLPTFINLIIIAIDKW